MLAPIVGLRTGRQALGLALFLLLALALPDCAAASKATPTAPPPPPTASPAATPTSTSRPPSTDSTPNAPTPPLPPRLTPAPPPAAGPSPAATPPTALRHSDPTPTVAPASPSKPEPQVHPALRTILPAVAQARGLSFTRPVQARFVTRQQMADYLASRLDAEARAELGQLQELYWALGLLDPARELYPLYLALLQEQVVGLFDLEGEELLVLADSLPLDALGQIVLAHELVHALQQQHFDARALLEGAEGILDQALARRALLEGDATLASGLFAAANLSLAQILAMAQQGELLGAPAFQRAPPVLRKTLIFPYEAGSNFVIALRQDRSFWRPVNQAYGRAPASTEQVLHPAKYLAAEAPRPVSLPPLLGDGWEVVLEDVLGEFLIRTYLETALAPAAASRAAGGWGGDRVQLLRHQAGGRTLVSLVQWDTAAEAQEFFAAYQRFADTRRDWAGRESSGKVVRWHSPGRSVLLWLNQDRTLLILSPDPETSGLIASAFLPLGWSPEP